MIRPTDFSTAVKTAVCFFSLILPSLLTVSADRCDGGETVESSPSDAVAEYRENVLPLLEIYCYGCHAEGGDEGNFVLDEHPSEEVMISDHRLWWAVLKNVRSDVMPPGGEDQPTDQEKRLLFDWIMRNALGANESAANPGRNPLRRLNRLEYKNTIRDLMGIEFPAEVEFPPDDSGGGFDNNADALTISPLLAEKYLDAAKQIVDLAVPKDSRVVPRQYLDSDIFKSKDGKKANRLAFTDAGTSSATFNVAKDASYRLVVPINIIGSFNYNSRRARVSVSIDDSQVHEQEYGWGDEEAEGLAIVKELSKGEHRIEFTVDPIKPKEGEELKEEGGTYVRFDLPEVIVEGPLDRAEWNRPKRYSRFFHRDDLPKSSQERNDYGREVLKRFCFRAHRRPVQNEYLDRLIELVGLEDADEADFHQCIAQAMTAVLASPRFLFRVEKALEDDESLYPQIDEYALASRLSYLFWSTMPDEELFTLASQGRLREQLASQVTRMLSSDRSDAFVLNFVGQWLQTRDVESVSIDPLAALGVRKEYDRLVDYLESLPGGRGRPPEDASKEHLAAYKRYREIRGFRGRLDDGVRKAMRAETERQFEYVLRENRSLLELLDADYTFLNEDLAKHYGVDGVDGDEMRRVDLPDDSPLGGVLTQGTFLLVTSNPTRTSPVKRGLFILDNLLGTPAPPAPAAVPELEESAEHTESESPTLRELLELHRSEPLCRSCHSRFDPLGLALENFTAIGTWRDQEQGKEIDPSGQLISGESFQNVSELKQILAGPRHEDFYRCVAERMLSYAIGRSLDYRDETTLEQIVRALSENGGRAQALLQEVVNSDTFQRMRRPESAASLD